MERRGGGRDAEGETESGEKRKARRIPVGALPCGSGGCGIPRVPMDHPSRDPGVTGSCRGQSTALEAARVCHRPRE